MKSKKSPEQRIRIKIGLIFLVIILYFAGLFIYSHSLKENMDIQKAEMDNSYEVLSRSNQLIVSIQQAQDVLNMYLTSPRRIFQQQYDSISSGISRQIIEIKNMQPEKEQDVLLQDIDSLLQEKNKIVRRLTGLFRSQNPLRELDKKINRYDEIIVDTVVVTTNIDTTRVEKQKKGFWNRVRNVFNPAHAPDTTINITRTEKESWSGSRVDTVMYAELKNITDEASRSYSSRIQGIEREVRELMLAEQNISLRISQLTNDFYNETIRIAWRGTENSEELTQKIFRFAIVIGALSILFILITILFIIGDLNKGQKARTELAREKQYTEELIESRHKLLLSVSHDIKTPLSSMMGYMEIWDSEEVDENKKRQLQSARNSGKHILNMLTNLLEFSRLQQKSATLHYSRFNLIELMEDIIGMFQPLTEQKALSLKLDNLASSPLYIETDYTLLKQILTNVVSNAVKYTLQGSVVIRLQYDEDQLVFTVTDTGIGMSPSELPDIFKPFSRMQSPLNTEGSGFGMYVTKGLVERLKGDIGITSEKGKGTCITITLPIRQAGEQSMPTGNTGISVPSGSNDNAAQTDLQFRNILLFEDDPSLGSMIREFLSHNGCNVQLASDHNDVEEFLKNISMYDIVFTDMQMTKITGTDILREIRKTGSPIPVWLMTAHDDYTTEKAMAEGFSGLVKKPLQMSGLIEIVSGQYDTENKGQASGENIFMDKFPQLVSLFGDDTETIRDILSEYVQSSQQDTNHLQGFIDDGEFEEAQKLCHKMYPFLCQLDAAHLCTALRKMDLLRGQDETAYPNWKEELSENIRELRIFSGMIRQELL